MERSSTDKDAAFLEHTLPSKNRNKTFKTYSDHAKEAINELETILIFTEIERESFAGLTVKEKEASGVKHGYSEFSYKNEGEIHGPIFVTAACNELRKEDRFFFESKIIINQSSVEYEGFTNDISSYGLSLTITSGADIKKGALVTAYFPELKNKRGYTPHASYTVLDSHDGRVRLHANTNKAGGAKPFFGEFIERNYEKLTPLSMHGLPAGLERALRNVFNAAMSSAKGLIQIKNSRACINLVNIPTSTKHQSSLFEGVGASHQSCDFSKSIFYLPKLQKHLTAKLREIDKDNPYSSRIFAVGHHSVNGKRTVAYHEIFEAKNATLNTISNVALLLEKRGVELSLFQISQTKKSRVYDNFYREELMHIERHAPHKHQTLCDLVRQTSGVFSITPIDSWVNEWSKAS